MESNNEPNQDRVDKNEAETIEFGDESFDDEDFVPDGFRYRLIIDGTRQDGTVESDYIGLNELDSDHGNASLSGSEAAMWSSISCLSLLSLSGMRMFFDPTRRLTFVEPPCSWLELAFERLPRSLSTGGYHDHVWGSFNRIVVTLLDSWNKRVLRRLKIHPPIPREKVIEEMESERKFALAEIKDPEQADEEEQFLDSTLTIELEPKLERERPFTKNFEGGDQRWVFNFESKEDFNSLQRLANLFSLAGASVYLNPKTRVLMLDARQPIEEFVFQKLPFAASSTLYEPFFWRGMTSITLTLRTTNPDFEHFLKLTRPT
jgi:hypothetical protein